LPKGSRAGAEVGTGVAAGAGSTATLDPLPIDTHVMEGDERPDPSPEPDAMLELEA
jgi:hypothetical protein